MLEILKHRRRIMARSDSTSVDMCNGPGSLTPQIPQSLTRLYFFVIFVFSLYRNAVLYYNIITFFERFFNHALK